MLNLAVFEWAKTAIFPLNEGYCCFFNRLLDFRRIA